MADHLMRLLQHIDDDLAGARTNLESIRALALNGQEIPAHFVNSVHSRLAAAKEVFCLAMHDVRNGQRKAEQL